jgi:hypothetical protein
MVLGLLLLIFFVGRLVFVGRVLMLGVEGSDVLKFMVLKNAVMFPCAIGVLLLWSSPLYFRKDFFALMRSTDPDRLSPWW